MKFFKKCVFIAFILILLGVILICGGIAVRDFLQYKEAEDEYHEVVRSHVKDKDNINMIVDQEREPGPPLPYPDLDIDFEALEAINPDFVGILYFPSFNMTYPVALSHDNAEYLHRTFEGKNLFAGCIFLEKNTKPDLSGWNSFTFGHNMNNGSMFGCLKKLINDQGIVDEEPYFYFYTTHSIFKYRIFAFHTTSLGGPLYRYVSTADEYDEFLEDIMQQNIYFKYYEVGMQQRPRIMTLSTCHGRGHVTSFVVHGALAGEYRR